MYHSYGEPHQGACMPTSKISASPTVFCPNKSSASSDSYNNYTNGYHTIPVRRQNDVISPVVQQQNDGSSSPLSFLYDRAQGESYYSLDGVPINKGAPYTNPYLYGQINGVESTAPPAGQTKNYNGTLESRACPTGSYQNHLPPTQYSDVDSSDIRQRAVLAGNMQPVMTSSRAGSVVTSPTTPTAPFIPFVELKSPSTDMPATATIRSGPTVTSPSGDRMRCRPQIMTSPSAAPPGDIVRPIPRRGLEGQMSGLSVQGAGRPSVSPSRDRRANSCAGILDAVHHGEPARKPWSYSPDVAHVKTVQANQQMTRLRNSSSTADNKRVDRRDDSSDDQLSDSFSSQDRLSASDIDKTSIRYNLREGDEIGGYEQESIRYTGHVNPSKIFRLLQNATGSDTESDVTAHETGRRLRRRAPPAPQRLTSQPPPQNIDDIVDISYVGARVPSRTFRFLQQAVGDEQEAASSGDQPQPNCYQPRNVKVVYLRRGSVDNIL